ncbi:MAG: protein kinase domain-containing protein [Thermoleophilaceae bacterium]
MIGTLLSGRFRLEERVGSGGMSTVYRAFDETLERWVAIKLLHRSMSDDSVQLERFRREARTVARLSHPHIVTVIDAGEDGGTPYIVFEYVEGETLKSRIKNCGPLPVVEAVAYAIEIGRALMASHTERLVHRDVKPQNVLIDADGRAKVTDFGISRSLEDDGLTATGRVLGTTDYVSPEQALGEDVTEQSDLYSLGVCLYEMLTGEVPFRADSQVGVAMRHVKDPLPDVQERRPDVSAALAAIVDRATCKERANRYASAAEMLTDLEQALEIEVARAGLPNGDATTVIDALPAQTGEYPRLRRLRQRPRRRVLSIFLLVFIAAGVIGYLVATNGGGKSHKPNAATAPAQPVTVQLSTAKDYDPIGGDGEHPELVNAAIDGNRSTDWHTSTYSGGNLGKAGVGLYVGGSAPVVGRQLEVYSTTPGWRAQIYAANSVPAGIEGWGRPIASGDVNAAKQRFTLDTAGRSFRYYLVWIVKLPTAGVVNIDEVKLRR